MTSQIAIAPRLGHVQAELEGKPKRKPIQNFVVVCHQKNGIDVYLRNYSKLMANYDLERWAQFGECEIVKRQNSPYEKS